MTDQYETQAQAEAKRRLRLDLPAALEDIARTYLMYGGTESVPPEHAEALRYYIRVNARPGLRARRIANLTLPDGIDDLLEVVQSMTRYLPVAPEQVHAALSWIQQAARERARLELIDALHSLPPVEGTVLSLVPAEGGTRP